MNRLVFFLLSTFFWTLSAFAQGQGYCDAMGCVVFEVSVTLDSHLDVPVTATTGHTQDVGGSSTPYQTVVTRAGDTCVKQVKVPQPVYAAITSVLASMGGLGSDPSPILTPAQQALLLFYSTLMQQTLNFQCTPRDIYPTNDNHGNGANSFPPNLDNPAVPTYTATYNGVARWANKVVVILNENGRSRTLSIGGIVYDNWIIDSVDMGKNSIVLRNGSDRRIVLTGEQITFP